VQHAKAHLLPTRPGCTVRGARLHLESVRPRHLDLGVCVSSHAPIYSFLPEIKKSTKSILEHLCTTLTLHEGLSPSQGCSLILALPYLCMHDGLACQGCINATSGHNHVYMRACYHWSATATTQSRCHLAYPSMSRNSGHDAVELSCLSCVLFTVGATSIVSTLCSWCRPSAFLCVRTPLALRFCLAHRCLFKPLDGSTHKISVLLRLAGPLPLSHLRICCHDQWCRRKPVGCF
jgi:hypothetical protein